MRIGELARRSGVTPPTLRFYEEVGLLEPTGRTPAGYRRYEGGSLARLEFIKSAKSLGLSLEEIKELLDLCAGEGCAASQVRLQHVLAHKIEVVRRQIDDQRRLQAALEQAYARATAATDPTRALRRELSVIAGSDCTCGASCDDESCARECACCPGEEVDAHGA